MSCTYRTRLTAWILALAIPCLTFGHAVFAQTVPILVTTDVSAIASAGIINHHDNLADYELDRTITRRETAKIIYRLKAVMNDLSPDTPAQCESLYSDILASDWGCGYISTLARSGIFSLRNTSFRPDDTVSRYEMILIVARLLSEQARAFQGSGASVTVFMDTLINYGVLDASESTMLLNNVNDNLYVPASRSFSFALVERALSTLKTDLWDNGPDMPEEDVYLDDIFGEDLSGDMWFDDTSSAEVSSDDGTIGYAVGGSQTFQATRDKILAGIPVDADAINENGIFSDYYFQRPSGQCTDEFCPLLDHAYIKNPLTDTREYWTQIALGSNIDTSDYTRKRARFVLVMDQSGSMGSALPITESDLEQNSAECASGEVYRKSTDVCLSGNSALLALMFEESFRLETKMNVTNETFARMIDAFSLDDEIGIVTFDDSAYVRHPLKPLSEINRETLKSHIRTVSPQGGTNMVAGYQAALSLIADETDPEVETRIIFMTDAMPTVGDTSTSSISRLIADASAKGINTTFVGVGIDYDQDFIDSIAEVSGANWIYANGASDLYRRIVEEFDYNFFPMFSNVRFYTPDGADIVSVVGSGDRTPTLDDQDSFEVFSIKTLFPTPSRSGKNRGGVILVQYANKPAVNIPYIVTYNDRNGRRHIVEAVDDADGWLRWPNSMSKAYLLMRYVEALKKTISEHDGSDLLKIAQTMREYEPVFLGDDHDIYEQDLEVIEQVYEQYDRKGDFWVE